MMTQRFAEVILVDLLDGGILVRETKRGRSVQSIELVYAERCKCVVIVYRLTAAACAAWGMP